MLRPGFQNAASRVSNGCVQAAVIWGNFAFFISPHIQFSDERDSCTNEKMTYKCLTWDKLAYLVNYHFKLLLNTIRMILILYLQFTLWFKTMCDFMEEFNTTHGIRVLREIFEELGSIVSSAHVVGTGTQKGWSLPFTALSPKEVHNVIKSVCISCVKCLLVLMCQLA